MDSMCTNGVCRAMDVIHKCRPRTMFGYVCVMSCNIYPARTLMVFNGRGVGVWDLIFLQNWFPRAQMVLKWVKRLFTRSGCFAERAKKAKLLRCRGHGIEKAMEFKRLPCCIQTPRPWQQKWTPNLSLIFFWAYDSETKGKHIETSIGTGHHFNPVYWVDSWRLMHWNDPC